ncbi:SDR family oxidoreductase [Mycobacterium sp. RTGN5]|uniref:SDR family NAD(P)-dependent oxidoreductase n=1 Tax=Mycobacterium sp. RTGN5 TaxID=3016522 RepID=UPI0029C72A8B|nr:SDR family oxidoreductase [Mycobacterium sp. RTGN5]
MALAAERLAGKVAIVTGAGRGIGREVARRLYEEGARVALLSRSAGPLEEALASIAPGSPDLIAVQCDMNDYDAIPAAIAKVIDAFGTIDILVNNAHNTSSASTCAPFDKTSLTQIDDQMSSGPISSVIAMQVCLPYLKQAGGRIINMGSGSGVSGMANYLPYAMAKEALRAASRVAAREWGQFGITVNTVCPAAITEGVMEHYEAGTVDISRMGPAPIPMGQPYADIAPIVAFLASEDGRYFTGYSYMADGGSFIDAAR